MYNILDFIDSKAVRDFNQDTKFLPAEQAILVSESQKTTVEEKLSALQEILYTYQEQEFLYQHYDEEINFRQIIVNTIKLWEEALSRRQERDPAYVYGANFTEKDFNEKIYEKKYFFTSYEKAYQYLVKEKQYYLDNDDLRDCITTGTIQRIKLDETVWGYTDTYFFDDQLRLVAVRPQERLKENYPGGDLCDTFPMGEYEMFIPAPFKQGDIVKVESPFHKTQYGVFSHEWREPKRKGWGSFVMSLDIYDSDTKKFWYTDDTSILEMEYCPEEELPKEESVLKGLSKVRKGDLDFFFLLNKYHQLDEIFGNLDNEV